MLYTSASLVIYICMIARPVQSRLKEEVDFWCVHYNRPVYQFVCPKSVVKSVCQLHVSVSETGNNAWTTWNFLLKFCIHILILTLSNTRCWQTPFILVEAMPRSEFWKRETGIISCIIWNILIQFCIHIAHNSGTIWNIWIKFCIHIDTEPKRLQSAIALPRSRFWKR